MLADDIAGRRYSKAEHRRALLPLLNERSEGSVEFKHQNISAVLKGLDEDGLAVQVRVGYASRPTIQWMSMSKKCFWCNE
ncbi:hypothetical protein FHS77_002965 [Paenochrobactrum gallinarii]|uniref:Uncharacterized protein n=1 Tax=Paenochrobactrum gallinarii TaxID=643673 RepID=A0A841M819_9HYPH|nr:hypothetical protein [Paenochrobactrum gallinarii]MBB6262391.1 hypothetical protein [Paenochrobactrum gallinarii]